MATADEVLAAALMVTRAVVGLVGVALAMEGALQGLEVGAGGGRVEVGWGVGGGWRVEGREVRARGGLSWRYW